MTILGGRARLRLGGAMLGSLCLALGLSGTACATSNVRSPVKHIAVVRAHGAAQDGTDATYRWGAFDASAPDMQADTPVAVGNLSGVTKIAAANESDLVIAGGKAATFGTGAHGDLGQGDRKDHFTSAVDVPIAGSPTIIAIGESNDTDVAVASGGQAYGWGWNKQGELCLGNTTDEQSAVELTGLTHVVQVSGGAGHLMYLLSDGSLIGCGANHVGQLGNGTTTNTTSMTKADLSMLTAPIASISAGSSTTEVLLTNGTVWMCGKNSHGQLGDGKSADSDVFVQVKLPSAASSIYDGGSAPTNSSAMALLTNGDVYAWGDNNDGQLGTGTAGSSSVSTPVLASALPAGHTWVAVATGGATSYVLGSDGDVYAFGDNANGEVGNGGSGDSVATPVLVMTGVTLISATADDAMSY